MTPRFRVAAGLAVGQVLGRGSLALFTIVLVHELTVRSYGRLGFVIALCGVVITMSDTGFSRLVVREGARDPGAIAGHLLLVRAAFTVAWTLGAVLVLATPGVGLGVTAALAAGAYVLGESLSAGWEARAVAAERPWRFAAAQTVGATALVGGMVVVAASHGAGLHAALAALAVAAALKLAAHTGIWRPRVPPGRAIRALPWRRWLREAVPFLALAALAALYYRIGVLALYAIRGAVETAPFAAASRVMDATAVVAGIVFSTVSPLLSRLHRDDPAAIWPAWRRMMIVLAPCCVAGALALALAARPVAALLFGERYRESAGAALAFLAPGCGLLVLQSITAAVLFMADTHERIVRLTAVNVTVTAIGVALAAAGWGSDGVAVAMSAAEMLQFVSFAVLTRQRFSAAALAGAVAPPSGDRRPRARGARSRS